MRGIRASLAAVVVSALGACVDADHRMVGTHLDDLAEWHEEQGRYAEAATIYERAVAIREQAFGPRDQATAAALHDLAGVYHSQGRYAEAAPLYERAVAIRAGSFGPGHPKTAAVFDDYAGLLDDQGRYAEAEPLIQHALAVRERAFGPDHPKTASSLDNLAQLYRDQGRYAEAEPLFEHALAVRERAFGPDHPETASSLDNLAQLYRDQGRYAEAEPLFEHALAARERAFGPDHPETASTRDNYAALLQDRGRYFEAEPLFRSALTVRERALGPDHPKTVATLDNLAELYLDQGRYEDAETLFRRALAARESILGPDHPKTAATLDDLAETYQVQGRFDDAEQLFKRALVIRQRAFGPDHPLPATTLDNLAALYHGQGRYAEAEPLYERAVAVLEQSLGPDHPTTAASLDNLATLYRDQARYPEAEPLYERALAIRERVFGPDHPKTASTLDNIAALRQGEGRLVEALRTIRRATAIHRSHAARGAGRIPGGLVREQQGARATFEKHLRIAGALAAREPGRVAELTAEAFEVGQLVRASTTAAALANMAVRFAAQDDALGAAIRARQDAVERWRWADRTLLAVVGGPPEERDQRFENQLRALRDAADRRVRELGGQLSQEFPEYADLESPVPLPLAEVERLLAADEALIVYVVGRDESVVWAVRPGRSAMRRLAVGTEPLAEAVRRLRASVDLAVIDLDRLPAFDLRLAFALYDQLLTPVAPLLEGARHLFIVADGPLGGLPFHLLVTAKPGPTAGDVSDYRAAPWLARAHATTTLPAASSLRALRRFAGTGTAPEPFLGVGDPMLDGHPGNRRSITAAEVVRTGGLADTELLRSVPALPETADELLAIANTIGAGGQSLMLREQATEHFLKTAVLARYRTLAFATHALVAGELDGIAEPALLLTPPRVATQEDDGLLTASEVARLELDADWVVLSACNTAAPDGTPGAEGLSGLARAFLYAGSRALLVSHWPVVSDATVELTTGTMKALMREPGIGRAEALRRSMLAMLADPAPARFAHPLFWAPFVVIGEGR